MVAGNARTALSSESLDSQDTTPRSQTHRKKAKRTTRVVEEEVVDAISSSAREARERVKQRISTHELSVRRSVIGVAEVPASVPATVEEEPSSDGEDSTDPGEYDDELGELVGEGDEEELERRNPNSRRSTKRTAVMAGDIELAIYGKKHRYLKLFRALRADPEDRAEADLQEIAEAVSTLNMPFVNDLTDSVRNEMYKKLKLEEYNPEQMVFDYNDIGDKLYMVWHGRVSVEVPTAFEGPKKTGKPIEFIKSHHLDPGKMFGELALMNQDNRRRARTVALKRTQLMVLSAVDYRACVAPAQDSYVKERVQFLRSVERTMLKQAYHHEDIEESDIQAMASNLRYELADGAKVICRQGAEADRVIFVKRGFCKVLRTLAPNFRKAFDFYAEDERPMPNPYAPDDEQLRSARCRGGRCAGAAGGSADDLDSGEGPISFTAALAEAAREGSGSTGGGLSGVGLGGAAGGGAFGGGPSSGTDSVGLGASSLDSGRNLGGTSVGSRMLDITAPSPAGSDGGATEGDTGDTYHAALQRVICQYGGGDDAAPATPGSPSPATSVSAGPSSMSTTTVPQPPSGTPPGATGRPRGRPAGAAGAAPGAALVSSRASGTKGRPTHALAAGGDPSNRTSSLSTSAPPPTEGDGGDTGQQQQQQQQPEPGSTDATVVVDVLQAGRTFGVMELLEGLCYQCTVQADPWAELYVISKMDLTRNTSKAILHKFFIDYKPRVGDDRLVQRLKQKARWNRYKRDLLDHIRHRKVSQGGPSTITRTSVARRTGIGDIPESEKMRIGKGEQLWNERAQTPPRPANRGGGGNEPRQYIFRVHCMWKKPSGEQQVDGETVDEDFRRGTPDILVDWDVRHASLVELEKQLQRNIRKKGAGNRPQLAFREDENALPPVDQLTASAASEAVTTSSVAVAAPAAPKKMSMKSRKSRPPDESIAGGPVAAAAVAIAAPVSGPRERSKSASRAVPKAAIGARDQKQGAAGPTVAATPRKR